MIASRPRFASAPGRASSRRRPGRRRRAGPDGRLAGRRGAGRDAGDGRGPLPLALPRPALAKGRDVATSFASSTSPPTATQFHLVPVLLRALANQTLKVIRIHGATHNRTFRSSSQPAEPGVARYPPLVPGRLSSIGNPPGSRCDNCALRRAGILTDEMAASIRSEAAQAMREGIAAAEAEPPADVPLVFDHAFVDPPASFAEDLAELKRVLGE